MPKFSLVSEAKLGDVDPRLVGVLREAIRFIDFSVLEGHRDEQRQNEAVAAGRSKTPWPTSKHNQLPSLAVDVAPYPIEWNEPRRFYHLAGFLEAIAQVQGVRLRWGGDWDGDRDYRDQSFNDLVHFELAA